MTSELCQCQSDFLIGGHGAHEPRGVPSEKRYLPLGERGARFRWGRARGPSQPEKTRSERQEDGERVAQGAVALELTSFELAACLQRFEELFDDPTSPVRVYDKLELRAGLDRFGGHEEPNDRFKARGASGLANRDDVHLQARRRTLCVVVGALKLDRDRRNREGCRASFAVRMDPSVERPGRFASGDRDLSAKDSFCSECTSLQLLLGADQVPVVRKPNDMANGLRLQTRKQGVVVAFPIHNVHAPTGVAQELLSGKDASRPSERLPIRVAATVSLIAAFARRALAHPRLGCEDAQWLSTSGNGQTRVQEETISRARLQAAQAFTGTRELKGRCVVQNQDVVAVVAALRGHHRVRSQDSGEADVVTVQKPIECLQLPFRRHRFREALRGVESKASADTLEPRAAPLVTKQRSAKLSSDVGDHFDERSLSRGILNKNVLDP